MDAGRRSSSRSRRQAVNVSSSGRLSPISSLARPTSGRRLCPLSHSSETGCRELRLGLCGAVASREIPSCALTISARAQNVTPSPYGRHRPCRQVMSSASRSTSCESSYTSRDLPIPVTPTSVTSCGCRSACARSSASSSRSSSRYRPTSGARRAAGRSRRRERVRDRLPHRTVFNFPFASTGSALRELYRVRCRLVGLARQRGSRSPAPRPVAARQCSRYRRSAIASPSSGRASSVTSASPVVIPMRSSISVLDCELADRERRTHRALGVVLVRDRCAEERHDRVADELLDGSSVAARARPSRARGTGRASTLRPRDPPRRRCS